MLAENQYPMSHDPNASHPCPKCGATAALLMPEPITRDPFVALKCLECAYIQRLPRSLVHGAGGSLDSNDSLE